MRATTIDIGPHLLFLAILWSVYGFLRLARNVLCGGRSPRARRRREGAPRADRPAPSENPSRQQSRTRFSRCAGSSADATGSPLRSCSHRAGPSPRRSPARSQCGSHASSQSSPIRRSPPGFTATTAQSYTRSGRPTECCSRTCAKRPAPRSRNHHGPPAQDAGGHDRQRVQPVRQRAVLPRRRQAHGRKHQSPRQTKGRSHEQRNHHSRSHRASAPQRAAEGQPGPPPTTIAARADRPACPARRRRTRRARFAAPARLHADDDRHAIADRGQRIRFGARQGDRRATQEQPIGRAL